MRDPNTLDAVFSALSHPVRREILAQLSVEDASVNELAEPFDMSLPAISRHIKILERAGLIERRRDAQFRPCTLNVEPLEAVTRWTEQYRKIWTERFDKMEECLNTLSGKEENNG